MRLFRSPIRCTKMNMSIVYIHTVYLSLSNVLHFKERGLCQPFFLCALTFSASSCPSWKSRQNRYGEIFMLQLVTAEEHRHERSPSPIIPVLVPLEEGPGPAGVLSASPERRHRRAIEHARPIRTRQKKQLVSHKIETKKQKRGTSIAVLRVWI
jgi:hypothetical protein